MCSISRKTTFLEAPDDPEGVEFLEEKKEQNFLRFLDGQSPNRDPVIWVLGKGINSNS